MEIVLVLFTARRRLNERIVTGLAIAAMTLSSYCFVFVGLPRIRNF
ncbi:MAG: hypothetical protein QF485_06310 [Arenicellales bacterium]|jgi:hypothetical protein|nr:hypothetical protein [Arenicellales bacterium]|tara:strand:- start:247 stop:384 length:138 start_codon:yes stop_codon:yes gene_type:complete